MFAQREIAVLLVVKIGITVCAISNSRLHHLENGLRIADIAIDSADAFMA